MNILLPCPLPFSSSFPTTSLEMTILHLASHSKIERTRTTLDMSYPFPPPYAGLPQDSSDTESTISHETTRSSSSFETTPASSAPATTARTSEQQFTYDMEALRLQESRKRWREEIIMMGVALSGLAGFLLAFSWILVTHP